MKGVLVNRLRSAGRLALAAIQLAGRERKAQQEGIGWAVLVRANFPIKMIKYLNFWQPLSSRLASSPVPSGCALKSAAPALSDR